MCMRTSVSTIALILGTYSLAFSVSGLFAVAASGVGGASPADGLWDMVLVIELYATTLPLNPFKPQLMNCACVFTAFWVGEKCIQVLSAKFQTLTCQGLDHSPCTTPSVLHPPHVLCYPSNPLMGLLINFWSCDGCVHRYDVSEC